MKSQSTTQAGPAFVAYIGIDWADQKHAVCLKAAGGGEREFSVLAHRPGRCDYHHLRARPAMLRFAGLARSQSPTPAIHQADSD